MSEKVGVYICHCGSNIAGVVDVEDVAKWAGENLENVTVSREYKFMCSSLGQELIEEDIKNEGLTRVVVGACSPHLHEKTFRRACSNAGLNPYLCQMTSLREQVSWVVEDKAAATAKAKAMVSGAVRRVQLQEELEPTEVPVNPTTLVVGGGIAGIQAALELADAGNPVYLVEREPSIGGHMAQFDKTFPTLDCAACILTPRMSEIGAHPNINLLTWSEVEEVSGFVGSFHARIKKKARFVDEDACTGCGICIEKCPKKVVDDVFEVGMGLRKSIYRPFPQAVPNIPVIDTESCTYFERGKCKACELFCPTNAIDFEQKDTYLDLDVGNVILATGYDLFDVKKMPQYGYGRLANVFTSLEFERMCNASGPTDGRILLRDGVTEPKSVVIVHCVGSRDENYNKYCSSICCMSALKFGHLVMERTGAEVHSCYIDMRTNQKGYEEFYERLLEEGMHFIRGKVAEITDAARTDEEEGKLIVQVEDTLLGKQRRIPVDMVILMAALEPRHDCTRSRPAVRHRLQHGGLVHRAPPETRSRRHHDRRYLHRRRGAGAEGHPCDRRPGRRRLGPGTGHDLERDGQNRTRGRNHPRGALLWLPHLQQPVPLQRHRVPGRQRSQLHQHGVVQGLWYMCRGLPGASHLGRPLQQRANLRRDRGLALRRVLG